jgi:hypothetical protein
VLTEEELVGKWIVDKGQKTRIAAIGYHFREHGREVGAETIENYLWKAVASRQEKKGAGKPVDGPTPGTKRYIKQGKYIDIEPNGEIVSFGSTGHNRYE